MNLDAKPLFMQGDRVSLPTKVKPKWLTWRIAGWLGLIREEQRIYVVGWDSANEPRMPMPLRQS